MLMPEDIILIVSSSIIHNNKSINNNGCDLNYILAELSSIFSSKDNVL